MVAPGFVWPAKPARGAYRFLGQINFAEIEAPPAALPSAGLLSIFHSDWSDDGNCGHDLVAHFHPDPTALLPYECTRPRLSEADDGGDLRSRRIDLNVGVDIPRDRYMLQSWPFDYELLGDRLEACFLAPGDQIGPDAPLPIDYLLGYPSHYSLGYDPTPGPDWLALLTLHSHADLGWQWGDGDKLMVFIEAERLAARDFSQLKTDAG